MQFKTNNIIKINNIPSIINRENIIILISNFIHKEGYRIKKIEYNFISKDKMLNINKNYLSHKTETDIITFDYTDFKKIEAEIYLCYSTIMKNASVVINKYNHAKGEIIIPPSYWNCIS